MAEPGRPRLQLHQVLGHSYSIRNAYGENSKHTSYEITIPMPIAELMLKRSQEWRWRFTDEGVELVPTDPTQPSNLPKWTIPKGV